MAFRCHSSLPDNDLSDDLTNQECIGHARADSRGVFLGVLCLEEDICHGPANDQRSAGASTAHWEKHSHRIVLVSIADKSKAAGKLQRLIDQ